jgi:hypothetical protein
LNRLGARFVVVGGFAMIEAGLPRLTQDVDLLVDVSPENEALVFEALRSLPDQAVNELEAGDVERFTVVRVADEIVVDLMKSGCGVGYAEAMQDAMRTVIKPDGVDAQVGPHGSERGLPRGLPEGIGHWTSECLPVSSAHR